MREGSSNSPRSRSLGPSAGIGPHRVIFGLRMMGHQGGRALLGHELKRTRERYTELLLRRKQAEDDLVIIEVRARRIPPRVALAPARRNPQLRLLVTMHPLRHRFRSLDGKTMREERLGVLVGALELRELLVRLRADGDDLHCGDVDFA